MNFTSGSNKGNNNPAESNEYIFVFDISASKLNETREIIKIVESDEDLLRAVQATPGAIGVLDGYALNSSVKVLRVDGKLPFDIGYAPKGISLPHPPPTMAGRLLPFIDLCAPGSHRFCLIIHF